MSEYIAAGAITLFIAYKWTRWAWKDIHDTTGRR
jgi:hypothetical protein